MSARKYLTIDEVAETYGVHRRTIRRKIADGTLPAYKMARSNKVVRIRPEDAEALFPRIPSAGGAA